VPLRFTPYDRALMTRVRAAWKPDGLLNPEKVLPLGKGCGELRVLPQTVGSALPA